MKKAADPKIRRRPAQPHQATPSPARRALWPYPTPAPRPLARRGGGYGGTGAGSAAPAVWDSIRSHVESAAYRRNSARFIPSISATLSHRATRSGVAFSWAAAMRWGLSGISEPPSIAYPPVWAYLLGAAALTPPPLPLPNAAPPTAPTPLTSRPAPHTPPTHPTRHPQRPTRCHR